MTLYPPNALKQKLRAGTPALGFWLSLNSLGTTEIAAGAGYDWLLLDAEHSLYTPESIERHLLAAHHANTDTEFVVRVPVTEPVLVKGLLDAGVRSFMFPFVETVEDAKLAVASTRYPPKGVRGFSGATRASRYGRDRDYLKTHEEDLLVIIQIESAEAVANIAAYGAIAGVDAMLIGANDLAANMGHLGDTSHPEVVAKFDEAGAAIMASGRAAGFQFFDHARARGLIEQGFALAAVDGDINVMLRGASETLAALR